MSTHGDAASRHVPVLLDRVVDLLAPALEGEGSVHVDATLGMGGHAEAVLRRCPQARVIGLDRDPQALELARERLSPFGDRFTAVHAVFDELPEVLATWSDGTANGILFDLGVSSLQLDEAERGFAYREDAPLDMRMDQSRGRTAADVLNTYSLDDLSEILRTYGEERFARRIAKAIVREREREPFSTSARLVDVLRSAIPAASARTGGHPAKRTFQALRIEVNAELDVWATAVDQAIAALRPGGRLVVESYHSLEDRITKRAFAAASRSTAPLGMPVERPEDAPRLRLVTRGAEVADADELHQNPRSASVRLRAVERTSTPGGEQ